MFPPDAEQIAKIEQSVVKHRADLLHKARGGLWVDPGPEVAWCHEVFDDEYRLWRPRGDVIGEHGTVLGAIHEMNVRCEERQQERPKSRLHNLVDGRIVIT